MCRIHDRQGFGQDVGKFARFRPACHSRGLVHKERFKMADNDTANANVSCRIILDKCLCAGTFNGYENH